MTILTMHGWPAGDMFVSLEKHWANPLDFHNAPMMFTFPSMKDHNLQVRVVKMTVGML